MDEASVLADLDKALKQFGTYNYYDKGVDEVFNASQAVDHVRKLDSKKAVEFLVNLSKHEHGSHLVSHIVMCLDDSPEKWFDEVVDGCRAADLEVY